MVRTERRQHNCCSQNCP